MEDQTEGSSKEGSPAPDESSASSKFKIKRGSIQRSNKFQRTLKRRTPSSDDVTDADDESRDSSVEKEVKEINAKEVKEIDAKEEKEIENAEKRLSEISLDSTRDYGDYDDYSADDRQRSASVVTLGLDAVAESDTNAGPITLVDIGTSVSSYLGRFTTQAWSYAKTTWQSYQDYLLASDSEDDDWGESKTEQESSDEDEVSYEDAAEEFGPRDRIHYICQELVDTEEQYVKRLKILVTVKEKTAKILKPDTAKAMFQDVEVIYKFHHENLLPQLQERLKYWEKYRRIGDIMKKFSPFLKLYTEYVKTFRKSTAMVDTYEEKSSAFANMLKDVRDGEGGKLKVQAHMMEPVQRVPRYVLLLKDYIKRLPEDSPDRPDTEKALELVAAAANHFESMIKRDSRLAQLMQIQAQLDGSVSIVSCQRELVKQGKVLTVNARTAKINDRYAFLFNDMLLVCNEQSSILGAKYKVKHNIDLEEAQVADGNNLDIPDTFYIKSTNHVVEFHSSSTLEREVWQNAILRQIGECTKTKLLKKGSRRVRESQLNPQSLGKRAPVLVRHNEVTMCMICASEFSTLRRKRHCRACGVVICSKCSSHTAPMAYDKGKSVRVCDECFVILQDRDGAGVSKRDNTNRDSKGKHTEGECVHKGYLQLSSDGGKTWKKRWFASHDSGNLYSFKAPQDISPLTSLSLKGFRYQLTNNDQKKSQVLELRGSAKTYYLFDEADGLLEWIEVLRKLVPATREDTPEDSVPVPDEPTTPLPSEESKQLTS